MLGNEIENTNRSPRNITLRNLLASTLTGTWPKIVIILFVVELVFLIFGSTIPISQSTINLISSQNNNLAQTSASLGLVARALFLFFNNFTIALYEFVPLLGWFYFGLSMYSTALAIEVIGITSTPSIPGPLITLSLLLQPHSWLELPAYAIATTQSFFLVSTAARRRMFKFEVARTGLVLVVVAAELIIAAFFESAEISLVSYGLLADFAIPWLAFAVLVILLLVGRRQILKGYQPSVFLQQPPMPPMPQMPQEGQQQTPSSSQPNFPRYCSKCGANLENARGVAFCYQCGQKLIG